MATLCEGDGPSLVSILDTEEEINRVLAVLESIANEMGWQPGSQLRDYRRTAAHIAVSVDGNIVGGLQVISSEKPDDFPYRKVWPEASQSLHTTVSHITILALNKECRAKFNLFWPLCVELWRHCVAEGATEMRLEATPATMGLYRRIGWPLEIIGDLRMHWDEPCYLCRMGIPEVAGAMVVRALRSPTYQAVLAGMSRPLEGPLRRDAGSGIIAA